MFLFRTKSGDILIRVINNSGDKTPYYHDPCNNKNYYHDATGYPVGDDDKRIEGHFISDFALSPKQYFFLYPRATLKFNWLAQAQAEGRDVALFQSLPSLSPSMPGHVLIGSFRKAWENKKNSKYSTPSTITFTNGDETYYQKTFKNDEEAKYEFEELKTLAPFLMHELEPLGYSEVKLVS